MTAVLVAVVVCASGLASLVLVLRFLAERDRLARAAVAGSASDELAAKLKAAEDRISKLEMKAAFR